jgi:hypothetical protein
MALRSVMTNRGRWAVDARTRKWNAVSPMHPVFESGNDMKQMFLMSSRLSTIPDG